MGKDDNRDELNAAASCGRVYWVTGLPGSGKTTLALALAERLLGCRRSVVQLDGDRMRAVLGGRYGYSQGDRRALASIYGRFCKELAGQGHDVVCATVSMFHEVRAWNRGHIGDYCEIYLRAPIDLLVHRHPRGLYARGLGGHIRNVPGVDMAFEEPEAPDLMLDAGQSAERVVADLFHFLDSRKEAA